MEYIQVELVIKASPEKVWQALIDPEMVRAYFFGTNLEGDWREGGMIYFRGEWDGQAYEDKGVIQVFDPPRQLDYVYWSSWSGTEDKPENYLPVSYRLEVHPEGTRLKVEQGGFTDPDRKQHSIDNWTMVMHAMKELLEEG
ncbi:MAG: SRPBCC domain-containing protein [Saprospiraceae bacterium]|nr:SRPBCC domain-containing protein [Saprospiraceae bacterium]HPG07069.1 SRPBCC domain-containing protein [Saprospiraceae bacterium]HPQ97877.1 SRPBCC domain-containing protein [Saprospiraceae bacterium]